MKKIFVIFLFLSLFFSTVYPYKLTIVYTGNTYSTLYPCGKRPASVEGGITRRATLIRKIREREKNVILVDGGNFTAGGNFDQASINPDLDKKRTLFYCQAMEKMGYDVVGVGEEEFNFGKDFFVENLSKFSFKFVSANLKLRGVVPYHIKEFTGFKVGIIGLSPSVIYKKTAIEVKDYQDSLKEVLKTLEDKVDFVILLSPLGDIETVSLIEEFPFIKIAIVSGPLFDTSSYEKIKDTLILRPSYRGKDLRIVRLNVEDKKNLNWESKKEKLSLDVEEDSEIKNIIPSCFRGQDCPKKKRLMARCQNPSRLESLCTYYETKKNEAILITDKKCPLCSVELPKKFLRDNFLELEMDFKVLDYRDLMAKELIEKYQLETLPSFVFPLELKEEKGFKKMSRFFEEKKDKLFLKKEMAGIFLYLKRKESPRRIDYFLDFYDNTTYYILKSLLNFSKNNNIELHIHFVPSEKSNFNYFKEELKVALAVKKNYPHKFFDYLLSRIKNIESLFWTKDLEKLGIDFRKIEKWTEEEEIKKIINEEDKLRHDLKIREGNVILIKNNRIFKVFQVKEEDLKRFFK